MISLKQVFFFWLNVAFKFIFFKDDLELPPEVALNVYSPNVHF